MYLTWFDNNTWLWEIGGKQILVDPWFVGELVFGNSPWFFKGEHTQPRRIPERFDFILLTQGLPDHSHPDTLKQIDRNVPIVGSSNAVKVAQELGFTHITEMPHGKTFVFDNAIEIQAFPGAIVGPFTAENGYVLTDRTSGLTIYYEPHGYHASSLQAIAPVDVVIAPIVDLTLPIVGSILRGNEKALEVAQWLQPQVMLPTAAAGDVEYSGLLEALLQTKGSADRFRELLAEAGLSTQVITPQPNDRFEIAIQPRTAVQQA